MRTQRYILLSYLLLLIVFLSEYVCVLYLFYILFVLLLEQHEQLRTGIRIGFKVPYLIITADNIYTFYSRES